jgi:hypothetical protein
MLNHFKIIPFLIGLVFAAVIFLGIKPEASERVVKWPRPENAGKVTYRDRNGVCYTFEAQITDCDKVKDSIKNYAIE